MKDFDVIIVGAGPGGCVAARDLARAGVSVALFDEHERETLGKPIVVEVEKSAFKVTGTELPECDEIPYVTRIMRVFSPRRKTACVVREASGAVSVFSDKFTRRLLRTAEEAGAKFHGGSKAIGPVESGGIVRGVGFRKRGEVSARLVIDATGFDAALVRKLDPSMGIGFFEDPNDIVTAANTFSKIDTDLARNAVRNGVHADGETWTLMAPYGPYSTEFTHLSLARQRAYVLVGFKEAYRGATPMQLIRAYQLRHGYFRETLCGGGGRIRIAHSLDRLVADGFLAIGEAANQVVPIHGSGVSSAMLAGYLAAKTVKDALASGDVGTKALWPYASAYQRRRGALLAAYDVSRRVSEKMTTSQIARLLEGGIMNEEDFHNASIPQLKMRSPRCFAKKIAGLARYPDLLPSIATVALKSTAALRHYRKYPEKFDRETFREWREKTKVLFEGL